MQRLFLFFVLILMAIPAFSQFGSYGELNEAIAQGRATAIAATGTPGDGPAPYIVRSGRQVYYTSQAQFLAENPGLPLEDLELGMAAPGAVTGCGPVISAAASPCFAAGDFIAGLEITPDSAGDCVLLGVGVVGNSSIVAGADIFADSTVLNFPGGGINAVGMHLVTGTAEVLTIDIYGVGGVLIDSTTGSADAAGMFWGVNTGTEEITQIVIASPTGQGELVDNILFGNVARVPTMSMWGLAVFFVLLMGFGLYFMRRHRIA